MPSHAPLVLVSNRGPVTFDDDGSFTRGGGGLVTALTGLASHRDAVWIASAMTDGDVARARESEGRPFRIEASGDSDYHVRLVRSDPEAYDRFYNVISNPMLWFIQHYLWDLSNAPDIAKLGECALSVNPFDVAETADSIHRALTMSAEERERRWTGLRGAVTARDPGDWIDEQLADIREKRAAAVG